MASFNFNSIANVKPASTTTYLKPYTINENVTIKSTEIKEGTTSDGNTWKSFVITFGNDQGIYKDSTFFLDVNDPKANERGTADMPNGGKRELPSSWERTYYKLAAIGYAFASDYIDKFNSAIGKCKTFDDFIKLYKSMIDKVIDKNPTSMKLVGRNSKGTVYASLPNCVGIAQATTEDRAASNGVNVGDWYTWMVTPFGNNLTFSSYEESQKNELAKAKPTPMDNNAGSESELNIDTNTKGADGIDFESLL